MLNKHWSGYFQSWN